MIDVDDTVMDGTTVSDIDEFVEELVAPFLKTDCPAFIPLPPPSPVPARPAKKMPSPWAIATSSSLASVSNSSPPVPSQSTESTVVHPLPPCGRPIVGKSAPTRCPLPRPPGSF